MTIDIVNSEVRNFLNRSYTPLDSEMEKLRNIGENDNVPIILRETEELLATLLKLKKPKKILEIGTAIGYSACFFAKYCKDSQVYTIEHDEFAYTAAIRNIKKAGVDDRVHTYFGDGEEQIEKIRDQGINGFDFVFIDASKSSYKRFMESSIEVSSSGAVIVSDNILIHGLTVFEDMDPKGKHRTHRRKMREYIEFITHDKRLSTTLMAVGDGVAVSILR
ncbi:MAG: class I SAM-dependent methyltransferase [Hornefia sp.]|nr:class I SAM-dependent methyltransferase [Hornefia sp.]